MARLMDQREYIVWRGMRQRCNDPKCKSFVDYGGRGIAIDPRWDLYENFLADMGRRPSPKHTIERINNDGPYSPGNCVWALRDVQGANTRRVFRITYQGETMSIRAWSIRLGIKYTTLLYRITVHGWPIERAFTERRSPCN